MTDIFARCSNCIVFPGNTNGPFAALIVNETAFCAIIKKLFPDKVLHHYGMPGGIKKMDIRACIEGKAYRQAFPARQAA